MKNTTTDQSEMSLRWQRGKEGRSKSERNGGKDVEERRNWGEGTVGTDRNTDGHHRDHGEGGADAEDVQGDGLVQRGYYQPMLTK